MRGVAGTTGSRHPAGAQGTLASQCCLPRAVCRHPPWTLRPHSTQSGGRRDPGSTRGAAVTTGTRPSAGAQGTLASRCCLPRA
eukprot:3822199-Pyramimonas_sp.AAC.1